MPKPRPQKLVLNERQKYAYANAFVMFLPVDLGLTQEQFDQLKVALAGQSPETVCQNIRNYKRHNQLVKKKTDQFAEEARLGIDSDNLARLPENIRVKIQLMYDDDEADSRTSILCTEERKANKVKRGNIQFHESPPHSRHYVPDNSDTRNPEPEKYQRMMPICEEELDPCGRPPATPKKHRKRAALFPRQDNYMPPPGTVCDSPSDRKKLVPRNKTPSRSGRPREPYTSAEQTDDMNFIYGYLNFPPNKNSLPRLILKDFPIEMLLK